MPKLTRYLSVQFLKMNLTISFAMLAILSVLDALSNSDLLPEAAGFQDHLWFMLLRAPILYDQILSFAFLLSLLVTYVLLIRRNELVSIAAAGWSAMDQIKALIPAVIVASLMSLILIDQAAPRAQQSLVGWLGLNAVTKDTKRADVLWLVDGSDLVRIETIAEDSLSGLTFFKRSEKGSIAAVSHAETAMAEPGGWRLQGVTQERFDDGNIDLPTFWTSIQTPETLRLLVLNPRYLSGADLWRLSHLRGSGNRASSAYLVWLNSRLAIPLMALGFLTITVSIMQRFGRDTKAELVMVCAMGGGFVYAILDTIAKTLPESAGIDPALAAFSPVLCLLGVGLFLMKRSLKS